jgi:hypothetical protein
MSTKLKDLWGKQSPKDGMFGAELEVESNTKLPIIATGSWRTDRDESLRSAYPFEYVTKNPIPFVGVDKLISNLLTRLSDKEVSDPIKDSPTTSWHIHLNSLEFTPVQLLTKLFLYWSLEPLVMKHCGSKRQQNTFALQLKDAYYILERFNSTFYAQFISDPREVLRNRVYGQDFRYAAQNMSALSKFGSVEYRGMRGTLEQEEIMPWINFLISVWEDKTYSNPSEVLSAVYDTGPLRLVENLTKSEVFSKYWNDDVDRDCDENALALLHVDDSKIMSWNEWTKMIDKNYEMRKYSYSKLHYDDFYESPAPRRTPSPRAQAAIAAYTRASAQQYVTEVLGNATTSSPTSTS